MAGDYTRFRYNPRKDATGILMQQGRVMVDQDWNEYALLQDRRWRTETTDIIGRAVVPMETPNGFEIQIVGSNITIGRGRMYVDGLMAENHGSEPPVEFDPVLGEIRGTLPTPYDKQPYYPEPPPLPTGNNRHLVYLDVWEREVTYLEDHDLIDKAVAVDTATRMQTVWQVKVLDHTPASTDCSTPSSTLSATAPSAGRLTTAAMGVPASSDPCIVPMTGGFRGSGNRLYRVEIHEGGPLGTARFKWSRDNASVASSVTAINGSKDMLTVVMTKRDSILRFQPNDWVEVTDDVRYFHGRPGEMAQVQAVDDVNLTITLKTPLPTASGFDATKPERHTRVIRWDQRGIVRDPLGNAIVDVDTTGGLIPVPAAGTAVVLEDGIQVTFSIDLAVLVQEFRPLEYWAFAARVVDASIEVLDKAPPRGILHHYAWLGFVTFPATVTSCRVFWPPDFGKSCDCTVCVSALSHNSGALTIQMAINTVKGKGGGKVCLGPGVYNISKTIVIGGAVAIEISGHGLPTLQATSDLPTLQPVILVERSIDIMIEDLSVAAGTGNNGSLPGIVLSETFFVRIKRCAFVFGTDGTIGGSGQTLKPAIALSTWTAETTVEECFFHNVSIGIGDEPKTFGPPRLIHALSVERNQLVCSTFGVNLKGRSIVFSEVRFADNFVQAHNGCVTIGVGLDVSFDANTISLVPDPFTTSPVPDPGVGIHSNLSQTRISANRIFGNSALTQWDGIRLGHSETFMYGTHVTGNNINNLSGNAIAMPEGALLLESIISQNQILNIDGSGIVMLATTTSSAVAAGLTISGNSLFRVALTPSRSPSLILPPPGTMVGILLAHALHVVVSENTIENIGPDPSLPGPCAGIASSNVADLRIAGNRLIGLGPPGPVTVSYGISVQETMVRVDITDNEVRRALTPPTGVVDQGDFTSLVVIASGDVSLRGNLLEGFGIGGTARAALVTTTGSCIFSENQCFWDGPRPDSWPTVEIQAKPVIANANYVKASTLSGPTMRISSSAQFAVVANIVTGELQVDGASVVPAVAIPEGGQKLNVAS